MFAYAILGCLTGIFLSVWLLWLFIFRKTKLLFNKKAMIWAPPEFMKVSEQDLAAATNNFSDHNLVGTGRSTRVYRGSLPQGGDTVAIKLFWASQEEDNRVLTAAEETFARECQTLGQIRHRNLVKIVTVCHTENIRALVLQFMPNGSLHQLLHLPLQNGQLLPLGLRTRLGFTKDIATALSYLHHDCCPPIIHSDVNPHNILLDEDMNARLSDFGMARIAESSKSATSIILKSSVGYVAPECEIVVESWRRDVYGFGMVVLEVLTRLKPTDEMLNGQRLGDWVSIALRKGRDYWYPTVICSRPGQQEISILNDAEICSLEQMLKMGVCCCHEQPQLRPTMREVDAFLTKCLDETDHRIQLKFRVDEFLTSMERTAHASNNRPTDSSTF